MVWKRTSWASARCLQSHTPVPAFSRILPKGNALPCPAPLMKACHGEAPHIARTVDLGHPKSASVR